MTYTLVALLVGAFAAPGLAGAQPAWELADPATLVVALPLEAPPASGPSPGWERGLLVTAGASLGAGASLLGALLVLGITLPAADAHDYGWAIATAAAGAILAPVTIPAGVFLFGNLSGLGADFGWTLLGSLLGLLPGAALFLVGLLANDAPSLIIIGPVLGGVGAMTGSIIAFEVSSRSGQGSGLAMGAGVGSLSLSGHFD